jgi:hypothetical protein
MVDCIELALSVFNEALSVRLGTLLTLGWMRLWGWPRRRFLGEASVCFEIASRCSSASAVAKGDPVLSIKSPWAQSADTGKAKSSSEELESQLKPSSIGSVLGSISVSAC